MKVNIFAGGLYTTFTARILPLAKALESFGVKCKVIPPIKWHSIVKGKLSNILSITLTHDPNEYVETLTVPPDIVIIGRSSTLQMYLLQKVLKSKGIKVLFDLDDALFLPTSKLFGVGIRPNSFCLEEIIRSADFVTVNGHALSKYVKLFNSNTALIHDPIDTDLFNPQFKKHYDKVTIGWQGNPKAHYENLKSLIKPLEKIAQEYNIKFKIASYLGDLRVRELFKQLEKFAEVDYGLSHWVPINKFAELLYEFDIMVAPLMKTPWYEGKSALKVGIGMALGIPVVASPVGEQKYVIKHGINGFLANNENEWYHYLKILIENEKLRKFIGKSGRKTAEKELSLRVCGKKLFETLGKLLQ